MMMIRDTFLAEGEGNWEIAKLTIKKQIKRKEELLVIIHQMSIFLSKSKRLSVTFCLGNCFSCDKKKRTKNIGRIIEKAPGYIP